MIFMSLPALKSNEFSNNEVDNSVWWIVERNSIGFKRNSMVFLIFFFFSRSALPIVFAAAEVMKPDIGT